MNTVNQMTEIKNNLSKLAVKKMQYQGALENFESRIKMVSQQVKEQFDVEITELQAVVEAKKVEYKKAEEKIINDFTNLAQNENIAQLITIQAPYTIETIQSEINKLLPLKSNKEGQLTTLKEYQKQLEDNFTNDFGISIKEANTFVQNLQSQLLTLQTEITTQYNEILEDEEIRALLSE